MTRPTPTLDLRGVHTALVTPFAEDGSVDTTARRFAEFSRGKLAETVIVEQKVGAGGRIAIAGHA